MANQISQSKVVTSKIKTVFIVFAIVGVTTGAYGALKNNDSLTRRRAEIGRYQVAAEALDRNDCRRIEKSGGEEIRPYEYSNARINYPLPTVRVTVMPCQTAQDFQTAGDVYTIAGRNGAARGMFQKAELTQRGLTEMPTEGYGVGAIEIYTDVRGFNANDTRVFFKGVIRELVRLRNFCLGMALIPLSVIAGDMLLRLGRNNKNSDMPKETVVA